MGKKKKENRDAISEDYVRLAKPRKKGLKAFIFSRFMVMAVFIALQVAFIMVPVIILTSYTSHFLALQTCLVFCVLIYLFSNSMDSSAKLTWMVIIAIIPIAGSVMLIFTQVNAGHRLITNRTQEMIRQTSSAIPQDQQTLNELKDGSGTDDLVRYLNLTGCFPAFKDTDVEYFPTGEEKFESMLEELKKAEKFIFMEYFIIEEGYMWGKILEILLEKAKAGVDVRVMYDGMCEMSTLPPEYYVRLKEHGIKAKPFSPIKPILSSHYNYRDHRKILVIDGKVAYNGGVNLADEYINRITRFGHWKDTAVCLRGPAVTSFTLMFLQMWNVDEKEPEFSKWLEYPGGKLPDKKKQLSEPAEGASEDGQQMSDGSLTVKEADVPAEAGQSEEPEINGYVIPYCDCPLDGYKVGEAVYMDILNRADKYVHIMTPYLILDGELQQAIKYAGDRGIDVRLILPGIPDKKNAFALAKSHYKSLLDSGVKIYEYTPGFVHAKVCVSDDKKAVVGTINYDYRSLYHHFECATYMYKTDCIQDIENDFQKTRFQCREVTYETIKEEKLFYKVMGRVMKFIAPLM